LGRYIATRKIAGSIPDEVIEIFDLLKPSSRIVALEIIQPLTEMSIRRCFWGKARPELKAENLTAIYKPIV
jgi:hypothetical protein